MSIVSTGSVQGGGGTPPPAPPKILVGGEGSDTLLGDTGNDSLDGAGGDDVLDGGAGNDTLIGGPGNDSLAGGAGADTLEGGTGNDVLFLNGSTYYLSTVAGGGAGADRFVLGSATTDASASYDNFTDSFFGPSHLLAPDRITDFNVAEGDLLRTGIVDGIGSRGPVVWRGTANAQFTATLGQSMSLAGGSDGSRFMELWTFYDAASDSTVLFMERNNSQSVDESDFKLVFDGQVILGLDSFTAGTFVAAIGTDGADTGTTPGLGSGNDWAFGLGGDDTLDGAGGDDTLNGDAGNDIVEGGQGNDVLVAGRSVNYPLPFERGHHSDTLQGGLGDDVLYAQGASSGSDAAVMTGGEGADRFVFATSYPYFGAPLMPGADTESLLLNFTQALGDYMAFSTVAAPDRITDFNAAEGDLIRSGITDGMGGGNYNAKLPLAWRGTAAAGFTATVGQSMSLAGADFNESALFGLWTFYDAAVNRTVLFMDRDRDLVVGASDFRLEFDGNVTLDASSFTAGTFTTRAGTAAADTNATANLGAGNDFFTALGGDDTLDGLDGNDMLYGDGGNDQISGGGGNDVLHGGGGTDFLDGAAGNDSIYGGPGADTLQGGSGDDLLYAAGDSISFGNAYSWDEAGVVNVLAGGDGNDTLSGGGGDDQLDGGTGNDSLEGGNGIDSLVGGDGGDWLSGGAGSDSLWGGAGADSLAGSGGSDYMDGGEGNDVLSAGRGGYYILVVTPGGATQMTGPEPAGVDTLLGGLGDDVLYATASSFAGNAAVMTGGTGADRFVFASFEAYMQPGSDTELAGFNFMGSRAGGFLGGGVFSPVSAPDRITDFNTTEGDLIRTGIIFSAADDLGLPSGDLVQLFPKSPPVVWRGATSAGFAATEGQAVPQLAGFAPDARFVELWTSYIASSNHTVLFMDRNQNGVVDSTDFKLLFDGNVALDQGGFTAGTFGLKVGTNESESGATLGLTASADIVYGLGGDDSISGLGGNDRLYGDAGQDLLEGGEGSDTLSGGSGSDTLMGGADNDLIFAGTPNRGPYLNTGLDFSSSFRRYEPDASDRGTANILEGGDGADTLVGGTGDDMLTGGSGNDVTIGNEGFDTAVFGGNLADFTISRDRWWTTVTGAGGVDMLAGMDKLVFDDAEIVFHKAIADYDADGTSELLWRNLVTGENKIGYPSSYASLLGGVAALEPSGWTIMGTADFDVDGVSDILWRNLNTGDNALWLAGDSRVTQAVTPVFDMSWHIAGIGDFDEDAQADILWRNSATGANVIWRGGDSTSSLDVSSISDANWVVAGIGDFDGDGKDDIFWRNSTTGANAIWLGGNSAMGQGVTSLTDLHWKVAGIGDFNGDGKDDILWRNTATGVNAIWRSADSNNGQSVATIADLAWSAVGTGDYNGDGKSDVVWRNHVTGSNTIWLAANSATYFSVSARESEWTLQAQNGTWNQGQLANETSIDFNGDGKSDLFWRNTGSGANAIWNNADSGNGQGVTPIGDVSWKAAGIGDFNGDGKADILWRNVASGGNTIWKSADSTTGQDVATIGDVEWKVGGVGDFNGDGKADILWRHATIGANTIWLGANAATGQDVTPLTDLDWKVAGIGDFDGDGNDDILWRNFSTGASAIWKSGNSATNQDVSPLTDMSWRIVGIGDFNGDGKDDIVWRNSTSGANAIWRSADSSQGQDVNTVGDLNWNLAGTGDYNGDGKSDLLWRNVVTGGGTVWHGASGADTVAVVGVNDPAWTNPMQTGVWVDAAGNYTA